MNDAPACPKCGTAARMDPLDYWYCPNGACDQRVMRLATPEERRSTCGLPGCGRPITDPVHQPDSPNFEPYRPR